VPAVDELRPTDFAVVVTSKAIHLCNLAHTGTADRCKTDYYFTGGATKETKKEVLLGPVSKTFNFTLQRRITYPVEGCSQPRQGQRNRRF